MNSYKKDGDGKLSLFKILIYLILICIPGIGWVILFLWILGDASHHNKTIDKINDDIKKLQDEKNKMIDKINDDIAKSKVKPLTRTEQKNKKRD